MCICTYARVLTHRCPLRLEGILDSVELELEAFVRHLIWMLRSKLQVSDTVASAFRCRAISSPTNFSLFMSAGPQTGVLTSAGLSVVERTIMPWVVPGTRMLHLEQGHPIRSGRSFCGLMIILS